MKQLWQVPRTGRLLMPDVPVLKPSKNQILVRTVASLVSVGTEKYLLEFAQKSLLEKALARPDLVRQVIAKVRAEGIQEAWRQAMARLDVPVPLGYSSAGVVVEVGSAVQNFSVGERVACSGSGFAAHAEFAAVPANLCVRIPDHLDFESATFAAVGGIALEAVRMAHVSLGCNVAVIGLGLLGQLAIQLLHAAGCHVVGMDVDPQKAEMALGHGAEAAVSDYAQLRALAPRGRSSAGFDSVIILAATPSNQPLEEAAEICRERGCVVAAGLVGLDLPRKAFYDKELELVVSRAWGPGVYDSAYKDAGLDYPLPYARWTAQRNLEEFVAQLAKGTVRIGHLISHRFAFSRSLEAYELILSGREPYTGVVLEYPEAKLSSERTSVVWLKNENSSPGSSIPGDIRIGVIGVGLFARGTILPLLKRTPGIRLRGAASSMAASARYAAEKFGFEYCTSDYQELLEDPDVHLVFVMTRHGSHARIAGEALRRGKHVFVEKPLALTPQQLQEITKTLEAAADSARSSIPLFMVGFNRRFSPFATWLKEGFAGVTDPLTILCTVNAGPVAADSWVHSPEEGGGRIIGEICHFVDLIQHFTSCPPRRVYAETLKSSRYERSDNLVITLKMANESIASITYVSSGDKAYSRERIEVFGGGTVGFIEDFKAAALVHQGRTKRIRNWFRVDRGHLAEIQALLSAIREGGRQPVSWAEYVYTTLATFAVEESLKRSGPVEVDLGMLSRLEVAAEQAADVQGCASSF
jgi:predicted dehydrogenase/threonine dehydrogenase-like Zn-dependent dehydrogenase